MRLLLYYALINMDSMQTDIVSDLDSVAFMKMVSLLHRPDSFLCVLFPLERICSAVV